MGTGLRRQVNAINSFLNRDVDDHRMRMPVVDKRYDAIASHDIINRDLHRAHWHTITDACLYDFNARPFRDTGTAS